MSGGRCAPVTDRRGQALAEFALVLPLILLFVAAVIEFGRAWNIKQAVTDAAREGARYTVVMDNTLTVADIQHKVRERLALSNIDTTNSTVTISSADPFCSPISVCFHDLAGTGREMTVSVSSPHRMPLVHVLLRWAGVPSTITINTNATMRGE